ncbi:MAG: cell division topological specificity factor MinE [Chloroflexi bacterium]|nr:cell division topological specificity factor MinE [Chloroflexota bacterium]MBU1747896.1 cell division topological specificity factor MinE [Chloroflexota bacterium]MBU1878652.1 cell division topological specificity factor MinE [Chloroflexota bacterium]
MFRRPRKSGDIAKERLQLVLVQDRFRLSPELLEALKNELLDVITRHVDVDRSGIEVELAHGDTGDTLIANIPLKRKSSHRTPASRV